MVDAVLVTGATGFIGRHLIKRLQERSLPVYALVRPRADQAAEARLTELKSKSAGVSVLEGDISKPGLDLAGGELDGVRFAHVFHLAALYDLAASSDRLEQVNVGGTKNLLEWLKGRGFNGCFHHVSSIAVAGTHRGPFSEADFHVGQEFAHAYHRTKFESERLVRDAGLEHFRIYRPGAVIGDSQTGAADRVDGLYFGFGLVRALREWLPAGMRIPAPSMGTLPLAPVDFVAEAIDALAHSPDLDGKTFHVFDPNTPTLIHALDLASQRAGGPRIIETHGFRGFPTLPVLQVVQQTGTYKYFRAELEGELGLPHGALGTLPKATFDSTEFEKALGATDVTCPPATEYIPIIWDYYSRHLDPFGNPVELRQRYFGGRVVLVTGGSSGVGEALAYELGQAGAKVVVAARRESELQRVVDQIKADGGIASFVTVDLSDLESCDQVVQEVIDEYGRLDVLINNAGHSIRRTLLESLERFHDLERLMSINYFAPARLIRGAMPQMRRKGFGHVINILSAGARFPAPLFGAYSASKAALAQLSDTLAVELTHENIHVTSVFLPWVRTPMMDATGKYEETPALTPQVAARWVLDSAARRRRHVASFTAKAGHGLAVMAPKLLTRILSTVFRIYADEAGAFPEFGLDRTLAKQLYRGQPL